MSCCTRFVWLRRTVGNLHQVFFSPIRCKSWSCPRCRRIKGLQLARFIEEHFKDKELFMLSFTFFHSGTPLDAWKKVPIAWNRFRTLAAKHHGRFSFIRVVEPHSEGLWPHIHVLTDRFIATDDVLKFLTSQGFGWSFSSLKITGPVAAKYLSKYFTKEWPSDYTDSLRVESGIRIVQASRDLPPIFHVESEWKLETEDPPAVESSELVNIFINLLHDYKAEHIRTFRFGGGFIVESDILLSYDDLQRATSPYLWSYAQDCSYEYLPYGFQCELDFNSKRRYS